LCILLPIVSAACSEPRNTTPVAAVDLLRSFDRAEKRPAAGFDVSAYDLAGVSRAAIVAPVPSRAIWSLALPRRGVFRAFVAVHGRTGSGSVRVRVGISDDRIYEGLTEAVLTSGEPRWVEVRADLSAYAGFKWSVFYHPDRITWRIVLASDTIAGAPGSVLWGTPQILTDTDSALEYTPY
jgi:hypothetical protein